MMELLAGIITLVVSFFGASTVPSDHGSPSAESHTPAERTYPASVTAEVRYVIDGDTIEVMLDGARERVRYIGIDAPEQYPDTGPECYAGEATDANRALVAGKTVRLEADEERRDEYGRMLRYVYVPPAGDGPEIFVNRELIENGYARLLFIPPNTRAYGQFLEIRDQARIEQRGLWGACGE